ncbi:MAG: NAD(P)-dependent oxidoreductase [Bacteroidia bacterium]|jgi:D-3-phosphoglycerate dehydrogenase
MIRALAIDDFHPLLREVLEAAGLVYINMEGIDQAGAKTLPEHEVLLVRSKIQIDNAWLAAHPFVKMIARGGAGLDNIDEAACALRGVQVVHAGGANSDAVGEQAVGMLLALTHRIASADREVRNGLWRREANRGIELSGRTVGILGYGHTGRAFARRIAAFGTRNLAYDKYLDHYGDGSAIEATPEQLFAEAEILSLHVPLTEETRFMVNADYLSRFQRLRYLLNLSRGEIVRTCDVVAALESGKLEGFAADVLEVEPPHRAAAENQTCFEQLFASPKTVLTPHVGGWTAESYERISAVLAQRILAELQPYAKLPEPLLDYLKIWENLRPC